MDLTMLSMPRGERMMRGGTEAWSLSDGEWRHGRCCLVGDVYAYHRPGTALTPNQAVNFRASKDDIVRLK